MIPELRIRFNQEYRQQQYSRLLTLLEERCTTRVEFRVAETPIFVERSLLALMASEGAELARAMIADSSYLAAATQAIPDGYRVAGNSSHPHFLTADFALVQGPDGNLVPRLVEIQAFPSVFGYQDVLSRAYRDVFSIDASLGSYLSGLSESEYWQLLKKTILGNHDPKHVVLTEIDPEHQKTRPDFEVTAQQLGISIVDISTLEPKGNTLHYRTTEGELVPIRRIYNRAIVDELISRKVKLPFDLTHDWDVEWAGHPNWYFLISKFSIPWLSQGGSRFPVVPPAAFLNDFLGGTGKSALSAAGVSLPTSTAPDTVYRDLLLKPLFSFAGKGIQFDPTQADLEAIPADRRHEYLLQQRMQFVPTIETPHGPTQAEIRILYLWPDGGELTAALPLVRLGRGKMMGVDHNRNQEWVGASAAFHR